MHIYIHKFIYERYEVDEQHYTLRLVPDGSSVAAIVQEKL